MRIVVCAKQTLDAEAVVTLDAAGNVLLDGLTLVLDPYSEFAVEAAIRIKEAEGAEVVVLTVGDPGARPVIRHALAMGADRGILVDDLAIATGDPSLVATVLARAIQALEPDLVLGGFKSADTGDAQVLPRVAELTGMPHVSVVTGIELAGDEVVATSEVDDGVRDVRVPLPAVLTAQQGLAEPRYPTAIGIMQSRKKPIETWTLDDLGIAASRVGAAAAMVRPEGFALKERSRGGRILAGETPEATASLVRLLRDEAKAI